MELLTVLVRLWRNRFLVLAGAAGALLVGADVVVGSVVGFIPFVGYVTILLSEYPWLKTVMLGFMALTVVLQRE